MAKSKKLSRPRKKRKYTQRNTLNEGQQVANIFDKVVQDSTNQVTEVEQRASNSSYVFVCGNKVLVRNLSDETLNERFEQAYISATEARRLANQLEQLEYNLAMEQRFRGLK